MPEFTHGRNAFLSIDGIVISEVATDADMPRSVDTAETSTFGTIDKTYVPGMRDGTLSCTVRFDQATDALLEPKFGQEDPVAVIFGPAGNAAGKKRYSFDAIMTQYDINASTGDVVGGTLALQRTGPTTPDVFP